MRPIVMWLNIHGTRKGPTLTDYNGELSEKVKVCHGCQHFGIHDSHYYYCSAQYAHNQDPTYGSPYPWRGAGTHIGFRAADNCPLEKEVSNAT